MPQVKKNISVGILLHKNTSLTIALLMRDILLLANKVLSHMQYSVEFISVKKRVFVFDDISIATQKGKNSYDYLLVTPINQLNREIYEAYEQECKYIKKLHANQTLIAAPCLGVILLAKAGIIDGIEATTHWAWINFAQANFPAVKWNTKNMLCHDGNVITAGGYLAAVDLILHLISKNSDKKTAHAIGRLLLAESSREKQSIYATQLISNKDIASPFYKLETWIDKNLHKEITVTSLASVSNMSLRNFQRQFTQSYGTSPKSFLQLKRIEKAKALLRDTRLSVDEVVEQVGFTDISSFRKLFQREIGITPAEFRRRIK